LGGLSCLICRRVGAAGTVATERQLRQVAAEARLTRFRHATGTLFDRVLEAKV